MCFYKNFTTLDNSSMKLISHSLYHHKLDVMT